MRSIPQAALDMNKYFEGLRLTEYSDGTEGAIGYGHDDPNLKPGDTETEEKADADEIADMETAGARIMKHLDVSGLTDGQWGALCDFAYNAGVSPNEPIWSHVLADPEQVPTDLSQRVTNRQGLALGGLILRRKWQANMWNAEVPSFTPPTTKDILEARAQAVALNS